MHLCKYARMHLCKYATMHVCNYAPMPGGVARRRWDGVGVRRRRYSSAAVFVGGGVWGGPRPHLGPPSPFITRSLSRHLLTYAPMHLYTYARMHLCTYATMHVCDYAPMPQNADRRIFLQSRIGSSRSCMHLYTYAPIHLFPAYAEVHTCIGATISDDLIFFVLRGGA